MPFQDSHMLIRLQKYMSERGICSRRQAEKFITAGKIRVNGTVVKTLGTKVDPDKDIVTYDEDIVRNTSKLVYVMLHKPAGVVTSYKQPGEKTVMNLVRTAERVYPIGRLDKDSTGLLLLTNDGELAYRLMHPKFQHEKEYIVETTTPITEGALKKLRDGVRITGVKTQQTRVRKLGPKRFKIILREGRNRQIRRMCRKVGNEVKRLKRIRIENIVLGSLPPGKWRNLTPGEYTQLLERVGLHKKGQAGS
jgi:23S rRNA pseudouridine2605 synthase/23S rRNA pseudouridine2604 synthase